MKRLLLICIFFIGAICVQAQNWTQLNDYFQVYTFSKFTEGLTIELNYTHSSENTIVDSIFGVLAKKDTSKMDIEEVYHIKGSIPVDTNGRFQFYRSIDLENKLLLGIDRSFFVYCTKGIVERRIKDVVFSLDVCKSNIVVFRFDKVDTLKFGHPVICSKKKLPLQFGNFKTEARSIDKAKLNEPNDYRDSIKTYVFAKIDSVYFGYADTFNWVNINEPRSLFMFPERDIYIKRNDNNFYRKWSLSLDLFGIPCD